VKRKGSISIFAALSIMLVAQMLFTFLEAARHREFIKVLQMNTDAVLESEFADYCSPLWENYRLLGMTMADSEGNFSCTNREAQLRNLTGDNLGSKGSIALLPGVSLLSAEMVDVEFSSYLLMTDQGGKVFEDTVCAYMKHNLAYETAKSVYNNYESVKNIKENYTGSDESIGSALDALESASSGEETGISSASLKGKSIAEPTGGAVAADEDAENPLTAVAEAKKTGVFSLVLPKDAKVSSASLTLPDTVSHRSLEKGTKNAEPAEDWYQKVLVNQYLENYLACYTNGKEGRAMNYELEYLLGGKAKDSDNLRLVVMELLGIREALNFASLVASPQKQAEALALATALAGITLNPIIIEVVKYGILAAWAFVESVLDLRTLLAGGKIALFKSEADWTSNVHNLPALLSGWSQAKESSLGVTYSQYLGMLLLFHNGEKLAMRAMDVQEATVCKSEGYENFRMDHVVCETDICATYEYSPIFLGFVTLLGQRTDCFRIQNMGSYSYREGKEGV